MKQLKLTINGEVKTFDLPENGEYKFEVTEHYVPKVGDCVKVECNNLKDPHFYWFKIKKKVNDIVDFSLMVREDLEIVNGGCFLLNNKIYTKITPEELKEKYAEAGYDWDYDSDTIKPIKWMPKEWNKVWYLNMYMKPDDFTFIEDGVFSRGLLEKKLTIPNRRRMPKIC